MHAANYYFQHLDCKIPIILISDVGDKQSHSGITAQPYLPQKAQPTAAAAYQEHNDSGYEITDDELDNLLQQGSSDDFNIDALQQEASTSKPQGQSAQVRRCQYRCAHCFRSSSRDVAK